MKPLLKVVMIALLCCSFMSATNPKSDWEAMIDRIEHPTPFLTFVQGYHCADPSWHMCPDGRHCCMPGANAACPYDQCKQVSGKCYRLQTDEDYKYFQQCCPTGFRC